MPRVMRVVGGVRYAAVLVAAFALAACANKLNDPNAGLPVPGGMPRPEVNRISS